MPTDQPRVTIADRKQQLLEEHKKTRLNAQEGPAIPREGAAPLIDACSNLSFTCLRRVITRHSVRLPEAF